jgi:hypothetical protein
MNQDEASDFFAEIFGGRHYVPPILKKYGEGWKITCGRNLATFDGNLLTRIVLLAHEKCIRVEVVPVNFGLLGIIVHKRQLNSTKLFERHPTIEQAIEEFRK